MLRPQLVGNPCYSEFAIILSSSYQPQSLLGLTSASTENLEYTCIHSTYRPDTCALRKKSDRPIIFDQAHADSPAQKKTKDRQLFVDVEAHELTRSSNSGY